MIGELLQIDLVLYAFAFLVIVIATLIQSNVGMGFGMIAAPALLLIDPELVPASILIMGTPLGLWVTWRDRNYIVVQELKLALVGRVVGAVIAAVIMASLLTPNGFKLLFSVVILLIVLLSLFKLHPPINNTNLMLAGCASGITGTVAGLGGPPMGLLYQGEMSVKVRGTLNAFLTFGGLISLFILILFGLLTFRGFFYSLILLPAMFIGLYCSRFVEGLVGQRFRPIMLSVCGLYALGTLVSVGWGYI